MKEKIKNIMSKWYSLVVLVLAVTLTIFSFTPIIQINTEDFGYSEMYEEGRYTSTADENLKINFGMNTLIEIVTDWKDFSFVVGVQMLDDDIEWIKDQLGDEDDVETETNKALKEELASKQEKLDKKLAEIGTAGEERIHNKLEEDEAFRDAIGVLYSFMGFLEKGFNSPEGVPSEYQIEGLTIMRVVFTVLLLPIVIITMIIFAIVLAIKFIIKLVQYIKKLKTKNYEELNKKMEKYPFVGYSITMMVLVILLSFIAPKGISLSVAIIGGLVVLGIFTAIQLARTILNEEKGIVNIIVKKAITLVSLIVAAIFLCNFVGVGLLNELEDVILEISNKQFLAEMERLVETGQSFKDCEKAAYAIVADSNILKILIFLAISALGTVLGLMAVVRTVARLRNKEIKLGLIRAKLKAMPVIAVMLLVISIVPTYISVNTKEKIDEAYKSGQLKIWYNEYQQEMTPANIDYELQKGFKEQLVKDIEKLEDKEKNASGEEKEQFLKEIDEAKMNLAKISDSIKEIEKRAARPLTCIIVSVIFVVFESAYFVISRKMDKEQQAA